MMRTLLFALAIWSGVLASPAGAAPIDAALQAELLKIYESFNAAVRKGDFKAAIATRDRESRESVEKQLKTEKQRKEFIEQNRAMLPTRIDVQEGEVISGGSVAELQAVATLLAPRHVRGKNGVPADGIVQQPVMLEFKREGGAWKYVGPTFRMAPSQIVKCDESNLSVGGLIKRVKFADAYTAIVVDVVGEENCLYLPNKAFLQKAGLNTDLIEPRAMLEAEGYKHRRDKQKAWLTGLSVTKR